MPLTIFFGALTLAPLVMALLLVGLGLARRATIGPALGLTLVGAVIPIIGLAFLTPEVSGAFPLEIALLGDQKSWLALYGRVDALSVYAAIGVAVVVAPLLLWLAWRAAPLDEAEEAEVAAATSDENHEPLHPPHALGRWQWIGVALALALESLALWLCFAENIVLLGIVWLLLIVVAWTLGELSSEQAILDLRGLGLMLIGPVVWLVTVLLIAGPAGARLLLDLTGAARLPDGHLFIISLALAFAAGAYPALAWLRKRASISTPAGLGAVALAVMPAALFVGARTFSIGATLSSGWPDLNIGKPSITTGIILALLGALSVGVAGLLALGRRDPRSLVAALTLTQAGWGLVGLGIGAPLSELGVTLLLATSVLGLGAVIAALVAGGAITADVEPDSAGPRIFGEPLRPALMFAWLVGCASLVGVPLLAGFASLQLISAESLTGSRLNIPLVGLAWAGSALVAIALTRATAPAFSAPIGADYDLADDANDENTTDAADASADGADDETVEETPAATAPELRLEELPSVALGVVIVIAGVAPAVALSLARDAAGATLQAGALEGVLDPNSSGYAAGVGQWFATPVVILVVVVALVMAYLRTRLPRAIRPLYLAGAQPEAVDEGVVVEGAVEEGDTTAGAALPATPSDAGQAMALASVEEDEAALEPAELESLPEPGEAWSDLRAAQRSNWVTPGVGWMTLDDEAAEAEEPAPSDADDDEADDDEADDDETPTTDDDVTSLRSVASASSEPTAEATGEES